MTRKTVLKGSWRRTMASAMASVFLYTTVAAPVAEANFWAERRKFARLPQVPAVPAAVQMPASMLPHAAAPRGGEKVLSLPALRSLPAAYADVETVHQAGADRPWVILLQDVHDAATAQKNIAASLAHLQEASGAPLLVGLEGAAGGFDLQRFRAFRNRPERDDVFGYLLDATHITGAEYFGLTAARLPRFIGVEDADLYRRNVRAYRRSAAQKAAFAAELTGLRSRAAALSLTLFDQDLRAFEDLSARRHAGDADLASFLSGLRALSPDRPGFAQVRLFLDALALEKSLDMAAVEAERLALIERLAARLEKEELAGLLESSLAYRLGRLSAGDYYRGLRGSAAGAGLDMAAFPAFETYVRYAVLAEKIDASLYPQIEAFRRAVGDALVSRPEQRRLLDILDDVRLLEKLGRHELGAHEWESYVARQADVRRLPARLAALENAAPQPELAGLQPFEDFYAQAFARNEALVSNLHSSLITHRSSLSVLVAGGFHAPGVQEALRARGLNYAVLRPRLGRVSGRGSDYLEVYAAEPAPLDRMLLGEKVFLAPTGSLAFRDLAELGHGERTRSLFSLLYGLLSALRGRTSEAELESRLGIGVSVSRRGAFWRLLQRRAGKTFAFRASVGEAASGEPGTRIAGRIGDVPFALERTPPPQSFGAGEAASLLAAGGAGSPVKKSAALPSLPILVLGGILWTAKKGASVVSALFRALVPGRGPPGPVAPPSDFRVKFFFENHGQGERTRRFIRENMPYLTDLVLELPDDIIPMFQAVSNGTRRPEDVVKELEPGLLSPSYKATFEGILSALHGSRRRVWGEPNDAIYAATDDRDEYEPLIDADAAFMIEPDRKKFLRSYRAAIRKSASQYAVRDRALRRLITEIAEQDPGARIGVIRGAVHTALFRDVARDLAPKGRPVLREFFASPLRFWLTDQLIRRAIFSKREPAPRELLRSYIGNKLMAVANVEAMGGTYRATHLVDALTDRLSQEDFSVLTLVLSAFFHASLGDDDHTAHMTPSGRIVSHWPQTHAPGLILDWMLRNGKLGADEVLLFAPAKPRMPAAGTAETYRAAGAAGKRVKKPSSWTVKGAALFAFAAVTFGAAAPDYFAFGLIALGLAVAAWIVADAVRRDVQARSGEGLRVALLQNYPLNVTGKMIAAHLRSRGVQVDLYQAWAGSLPDWEHYDAIIGSGSAYNPREHRGEPWLESEINLIRQARIPILGVCFTHQLIAEAFSNGRTRKAYDYAIYTGPNQVTVDTKDPLFKGLPKRISVAEAHGDEVSAVPDEMIVTAGSEMTRVEAMRHRDRPIYAVQFHPEHGDMMEQHGLSNKHGAKVLDNFIRIVRGHRREQRVSVEPSGRRRPGFLALLAAALFGLSAPAMAGDPLVVRGDDGRPRLNLPPLVRHVHEDGTESVVGLRTRRRSLDVVATKPLTGWLEGSIYAGAFNPPRELRERGQGSRVEPHVGIELRIRLGANGSSSAPARKAEPEISHDKFGEILKAMRFPGARMGMARSGLRHSVVWVATAHEVILINDRETVHAPTTDVLAALGQYFQGAEFEVVNGRVEAPAPAETPSETKPSAALMAAPLAVLSVFLFPGSASAAGLTATAASIDIFGLGLLALAVVAAGVIIARLIRARRALLMALTAVALSLASPATAQDGLIVRGEDGKLRLNLPPLLRTTDENGTETVVDVQSRDRSVDVVARRPLGDWLEGSIYAGAHRPERPDIVGIRRDDGPSVGWHVGIGIRMVPQPAPSPRREERPREEEREPPIDVAEVLRHMNVSEARSGIARAEGRTAVWVWRPDQVILITGRETFLSGETDIRRAATLFFHTNRVELLDADGNPLPAATSAPTETTQTPSGDAVSGTALNALPLAFLGLFALPTPADAAGWTMTAASVDHLGLGILALAAIAAFLALRAIIRSRRAAPKTVGGAAAGAQGPGESGGQPIVPPARRGLLARFDEKGLSAAEKLSQNAGLLSAWAVLDDPRRFSVEPIPASTIKVARLLQDLHDSSIKLLDAGAVSRHERTLLALQSFAAQFAIEAETAPDLAKKRYGANAAGVALLLGALSDVSPELAESLRPALLSDVLSLRRTLSAEVATPRQVDALAVLQRIGAESAGLPEADDVQGRVLQISDVLGDSVSDPDYIAALARQLPQEADEARAALVVTDDESALRAALRNAGVALGRNVAVRSVDSLPASAVRRDARGRLESIDVAALPGAGDALAKIRIFTRTPALWWLGNIDQTRREALVEFLLWVTRDAAFRLTPARLEEALQAQKTLEIQA